MPGLSVHPPLILAALHYALQRLFCNSNWHIVSANYYYTADITVRGQLSHRDFTKHFLPPSVCDSHPPLVQHLMRTVLSGIQSETYFQELTVN